MDYTDNIYHLIASVFVIRKEPLTLEEICLEIPKKAREDIR